MSRSLFALMLLAISTTSQAAAPSINIGSLHDQLPPDTSRFLKRVRNSGDATAYVRVEVSRIVFDDPNAASEEPIDAAAVARAESGASGVIASPSRLIVPANGGQQATTLVYRGSRDVERYYRIRFVPVVPSGNEFALTDAQQGAYRQDVAASVSVFTGYGSILIVPPQQVRYATRVEGHTIHNDGNATIVLENLRTCPKGSSPDCPGGVKVHVRPGQQHRMEIPPQHTAHFQVIEGTDRRDIALAG